MCPEQRPSATPRRGASGHRAWQLGLSALCTILAQSRHAYVVMLVYDETNDYEKSSLGTGTLRCGERCGLCGYPHYGTQGGAHARRSGVAAGVTSVSQKGSVLRAYFRPVKSIPCLVHMSVAQSQACKSLTDGGPQRDGAPGEDGPGREYGTKTCRCVECSPAACAEPRAPAGVAWLYSIPPARAAAAGV
jgi:hypothetical protein